MNEGNIDMEEKRTLEQQRERTRERQQERERTTDGASGQVLMKVSPDVDAKYEKILRQPRSRKFTKALQEADLLTADDEALIERMKEVIEEETGEIVEEDYVFDASEIDAFRQSMIETCEKSISAELEKEAQRMGEMIEAEKKPVRLISTCAISGCVVHSFLPNGAIETHYTPAMVSQQDFAFQKATEILLAQNEWTSVEVFTRKLVHRNNRGDVIKIYNLSEE